MTFLYAQRRHQGRQLADLAQHKMGACLAEGLFHQRHLCSAGKIAAVYTVKCKAQLRIVCQCGGNKSALICARRYRARQYLQKQRGNGKKAS